MKKIAIVNIPMLYEDKYDSAIYKVVGNSTIESGITVRFPINSVFAKVLKKDDTVKVLLMGKKVDTGNTENNIRLFKEELEKINKNIGAKIEYEEIISDYNEVKEIHKQVFDAVLDRIEVGAEVYADITYGPKSLPILIFALLNFMEKFYDIDLKNIIYGNVEFKKDEKGEMRPVNPQIYDLTSLYFLNSVINFMNADSIEDARTLLDKLLKY